MGTSTSSRGAPSGVSFDPPWIGNVAEQIVSGVSSIAAEPEETAPSARFGAARRDFSKYLRDKDEARLAAAVASYVKRGLGGARHATSRMRIPVAASVAMLSALHQLADHEEMQAWIERVLSSKDKLETLEEELINQIVPAGGSVDEESCRRSMAYALSEFGRENPGVNIEEADEDALLCVLNLFLAREIFNRLVFDLGQRLEQIEISEMPRKEKEIMRYIRSTLGVQVGKLRSNCNFRDDRTMLRLITDVVRETFEVFEGGEE